MRYLCCPVDYNTNDNLLFNSCCPITPNENPLLMGQTNHRSTRRSQKSTHCRHACFTQTKTYNHTKTGTQTEHNEYCGSMCVRRNDYCVDNVLVYVLLSYC